ncbi:hypothetical protein D3C85_945400 [compost metagenome]
MHHEQVDPQRRRHGFQPDLGRSEPVQALPPVEQHLQADHAEGEGAETEEIERRRFLGLLLGQQQRRHQEDKRRQWHAEIEHRPPAKMLGDPATDTRAADDAEQHDGGPARAKFPTLVQRQGFQGNRHRQRCQHATGDALNDARPHELQRRRCRRGEQQAKDKQNQRCLIHPLQAKAPG